MALLDLVHVGRPVLLVVGGVEHRHAEVERDVLATAIERADIKRAEFRSPMRCEIGMIEVERGSALGTATPANSWLIMNPGGGPTPDKPEITRVDYERSGAVSSFMNLRVADIQDCYER